MSNPWPIVKVFAIREHPALKPALGAGLSVFFGLLLWGTLLGQAWVNTSYDYLFRFVARRPGTPVALILMDNESLAHFGQERGHWDRELHTELLNRLAADKCRMVVFDTFFGKHLDPIKDQALEDAMRRVSNVVLMAEPVSQSLHHMISGAADADSAYPKLPLDRFLGAANTNSGVAWLDADLDSVVRRHWPFPAPGPTWLQSLPWTAARLMGAKLSSEPQEQWLRYYGEDGAWDSLPYTLALEKASNYFKGKVVFIGNKPESLLPDRQEVDKFSTPYTRWTGEAAGGVEIIATAFLNLLNGEWLRRPARWAEIGVLLLSGTLLGGALCRVRPLRACWLAGITALLVMLAAVSLSQITNFWFPWLVISGGQVPCALVWSLATAKVGARRLEDTTVIIPPQSSPTLPIPARVGSATDLPETPDYELVDPPFGEGSYGKVWLARNAIGQWQALKAVYLAKFGAQTQAYDREFSGIKNYKPISDRHPALLRVDFVSKKKRAGYFYYVMELADGLEPGWEKNPSSYVPCDLARVRAQAEGLRLPPKKCIQIGLELAGALDFLHRQGLTHRDVKPQNIVFVKGQPKLADVGLVAEVRLVGENQSWVGTPGYMPPPPEPPGTPSADIFGLGMVLYVLLTGRSPTIFPALATTLLEQRNPAEFMGLNDVILKACETDLKKRYASASELAAALKEVQNTLDCETPAHFRQQTTKVTQLETEVAPQDLRGI